MLSKRVFDALLLAIASIVATVPQIIPPVEAADRTFAVAGYLPEWRYEGANWDTLCQHLSHLILFSLEVLPDGGGIGALDRIPRPEFLHQAHAAAKRHGAKVLICFGGNGRSAGFSAMVQSDSKRRNFVNALVELCDKYGFHGVDYNWEYPGYIMGRGYMAQEEIEADYGGLVDLLRETRVAFVGSDRSITLSYYPDGRQEALLAAGGAGEWVDYMFSMSYDQGGEHHSSDAFARKTVTQMLADPRLPNRKMCLGLPFYGRSVKSGHWMSYEDLVQKYAPLDPQVDVIDDVAFNGRETIAGKTKHAIQSGIGGVMVWEVGQDCRLEAVTHGKTTHVVTCPDGTESSLLVAISRAMAEMNVSKPTLFVQRHGEEL